MLDSHHRSNNHSSLGKLVLGSTCQDFSKITKAKKKVLSTVGPQDYNPNKIGKRVPKAIIKDSVTPEPALGNVKNQMEFYLNRVFQEGDKNGPDKSRQGALPDYH